MQFRDIKQLVKLVESSDLASLDIEEKDFKISIVRNQQRTAASAVPNPAPLIPQTAAVQIPTPAADSASPIEDSQGLIPIPSPMVGTFYGAPAPDAPPYVKPGDTVSEGKIICIIEAMKLMNEIEAEVNGKIVKVLVANGEAVEYNQPLFMVEPV